jgi:hypothetical protein
MADLQQNEAGAIVLLNDEGELDKQTNEAFMYIDSAGELQLSAQTVQIKNVSGTTLAKLAAIL